MLSSINIDDCSWSCYQVLILMIVDGCCSEDWLDIVGAA
jgi:hypothetical protein